MYLHMYTPACYDVEMTPGLAAMCGHSRSMASSAQRHRGCPGMHIATLSARRPKTEANSTGSVSSTVKWQSIPPSGASESWAGTRTSRQAREVRGESDKAGMGTQLSTSVVVGYLGRTSRSAAFPWPACLLRVE